ncbi:hypothetical protein PUNSTDRAFT_129172 [Punctularia strigosozonata HHB-11173 SS5]|uniref:uncharacterized protein n=1 Tax=Punctularia strigosozonata (strain HHB-11173) TaxID=741275 RepID=UPI00044172BE|nr:uncharacterized protein PUNSTDRAFT_129172 [Punctularia strigosozonata HHB-11173 SS5]EIN13492.1 hypothetical protein PUNSTDRAFT_129172 [Punctularia strigosozonata HHB-11173 SS5]
MPTSTQRFTRELRTRALHRRSHEHVTAARHAASLIFLAMAKSEIDDIFASASSSKAKAKGKGKTSLAENAKLPAASTSAPVTSSTSKKHKKKRKRAQADDAASTPAPAPAEVQDAPKRAAPETVVDPSTRPLTKKPKTDNSGKPSSSSSALKKPSRKAKPSQDDDELFKDSRGTSSRRKTEEGFTIFKEADLGIDPEAGGTPLSCFSNPSTPVSILGKFSLVFPLFSALSKPPEPLKLRIEEVNV